MTEEELKKLQKMFTTQVTALKEQTRILNEKIQKLEESTASEPSAGKPISDLSPVTDLKNESAFPIVQDSATSKVSIENVKIKMLGTALVVSAGIAIKYILSKKELDLSNHFILDENGKDFYNNETFEVILPYTKLGATSRIIRFTRYHGVSMEVSNINSAPHAEISGINGVRVAIKKEKQDGTLENIIDLAYKGESVEVFIEYDASGNLTQTLLLTQLPFSKVDFRMGNKNITTIGSTFLLENGLPCSQLFPCFSDTTEFTYDHVFLCIFAKTSEPENNPFRRSIPSSTDDYALFFPIKNEESTDTGYNMHIADGYTPLMSRGDGQYYTPPLGGHFPRINQKGEEGILFYPDTTAKHRHDGVVAYDYYRGDGSVQPAFATGSYTGYNVDNVSYETAGRWVGLQAWIYL